MHLLSTSNYKTLKGNSQGYMTGILHFAPGHLSGYQVCPFASAGCLIACLNTAGRGIFKPVQDARINKTKRFFEDRAAFLADLDDDISALIRKSARENMTPCVRLNGTSDILWEKHAFEIMDKYRSIQFYDYTKIIKRTSPGWGIPENYHLTFSRSESNEQDCEIALARGYNVAVVFSGELPKTWKSFPVVSGDENDLRFLDGKNVVVGLSAKGRARRDDSGFVVAS